MEDKDYFDKLNEKFDKLTPEKISKLIEKSIEESGDYDCSRCNFTEANACDDCCKEWELEEED